MLRNFTPKDIIEYRDYRLEKVSKETVNLEIRHLKTFFNCAKNLGYLIEIPFDGIKPIRVHESELPRFFELDEIENVRNHRMTAPEYCAL